MSGKRSRKSKKFSLEAEMRKLPKALKPFYATAESNERVQLYEGPLLLRGATKRQRYQDEGKVYLRWQPFPRIEFEILGARAPSKAPRRGTVELSKLRWCSEFFITAQGGVEGRVRGVMTQPLSGYLPRTRTRQVTSIIFHLPNTSDLVGEPVTEGTGFHTSRVRFQTDDWLVSIDILRHHRSLAENLSEKGGYAITATGKIEKLDGNRFDPAHAKRLITDLHWFFSFMWGRWTGPTLLVGLGAQGQRVWENWSVPKLGPWSHVEPWIPRGEPQKLTEAFAGMHGLLDKPLWEHSITLAIHWYVEALNQAGAVHGGIIMSQAAFELLWWTVFVGDGSIIHEPDKVIAADKIRLLLHHHGIPAEIPPPLKDLAKKAKAENWPDGPTAITQLRNMLVHPGKGRKHRPAPDGAPVVDAWKLAIWYLELTLLAASGYRGVYCPRIPGGGNVLDTKRVPWA
jgi:hypothetical protein